MILRRFYDDKLAQASYLVGCEATGEALVVDPNRDAARYVEAARRERVRITHVAETHIHADFVSGTRELAALTGATPYLSAEGGPDWRYGFAADAGAVLLRNGDVFMVGNVRIQPMHTPGHTPEHLTFLVTDTAGADEPMGAFTGDFVFVGDVGRPDLLETAAGVEGTMEGAARELFRSLQRFRELPDHLQIWPGHGAGSACGKSPGAVPQSTVGYERRFNWAFGQEDEDAFVAAVLDGQPEPPAYFAEMKRVNRDGPRVLGESGSPPRLGDDELADALERDAVVVDTRPASAFAAGHVPGTIDIPLNRTFTTRAGSLLPYDRDVYLIAEANDALDEAARDLRLIGLDRLKGGFDAGAATAWADRRGELETIAETTPAELAEALERGDVTVIDVRRRSEWNAGHLAGAATDGAAAVVHIPLGDLPARIDEVPSDRPLVVHCRSGGRSAIGASVLQASGRKDVRNLRGGYLGWRKAGLPVETG